MKTLAETLNDAGAFVCYEDNRALVLDEETNELPQEVGDFFLLANNNGVDASPQDGLWYVSASANNDFHTAAYNEKTETWTDA